MPQYLSNMMTPVLALVVWTLIILVWLYLRRIPAMRKAGIDPAKIKGSESYASLPPMNPKAVWVADNYNHLHEAPTLFYAAALMLAMIGQGDGFNVWIAWMYVWLRILHSVVQATVNVVPVRFALFLLSTVALIALIFHAAIAVFDLHLF